MIRTLDEFNKDGRGHRRPVVFALPHEGMDGGRRLIDGSDMELGADGIGIHRGHQGPDITTDVEHRGTPTNVVVSLERGTIVMVVMVSVLVGPVFVLMGLVML